VYVSVVVVVDDGGGGYGGGYGSWGGLNGTVSVTDIGKVHFFPAVTELEIDVPLSTSCFNHHHALNHALNSSSSPHSLTISSRRLCTSLSHRSKSQMAAQTEQTSILVRAVLPLVSDPITTLPSILFMLYFKLT
jgi:hypothetical protein